MHRLLLVTAFVLAFGIPALAKPPGAGIQWSKTWKEALEEAKIRNVPIHVAFHKDH